MPSCCSRVSAAARHTYRSTSAPPQAAPAAPARAGEVDAGDTSQALAGALERAQAQGWQQLHILVECRSEGQMTGVELFGSGVGIWNGERQFRLTHEELRTRRKAEKAARESSGKAK